MPPRDVPCGVLIALALLALALFIAFLILFVPQPRIVAAQPTASLERIGPNADRPLHPGERGWLIGPDQPMPSDGARVALLGCNTVACVWSVEPTRLDWRAGSVRQGRRLYFPIGGRR